MADREKVIRGLELCLQGNINLCKLSCAYYQQCGAFYEYNEALLKDALSLLKAQEPVHVKYLKMSYGKWLLPVCGNCGEQIREDWKCCPVCGKAVKWDE